jgi:integrase
LVPSFGQAPLAKITAQDVRSWLASMRATDLSPNTVAKAYRLFARVMGGAVEAGVIGRSPYVVRGASTERSPEMRFATVGQVAELADAVEPRYRALVLTAAYAGLRWGELAGLRRRRVNLLHATITVAEQLRRSTVDSRSARRRRRPADARWHCPPSSSPSSSSTSPPGASAPMASCSPAPEGGPMRRSNFRRRAWEPVVRQLDLAGLRFHDLRHSAGTLTAVAGATTKELMARMGHSSPRAALIYQHATAERDAAVAAALDAVAASPRPGCGESSRAAVAHLR